MSASLTAFQSMLLLVPAHCTNVRPDTGTFSKRAEKRCNASTLHKLAVVVCQAPARWRARWPATRRGTSSFHSGRSVAANSKRAAFASGPSISHHQSSLASVLKRSVVPPCVSRVRMRFCTSASRAARSGTPSTRRSTAHQSSSAEVGQVARFSAIEPSMRGVARPCRDSASSAASLRTSRSSRGALKRRITRPSTKAARPCSMRSRAASGQGWPASCAAATR